MNPPFIHGQDIRHILRAFSLLRPGGVLVAVCLNGPRQQEKLLPFSDIREELPRGTFAYSEIQNFCLHGTVGAGKSEVIRRLANYARQRGDMVVIYDRSGNG